MYNYEKQVLYTYIEGARLHFALKRRAIFVEIETSKHANILIPLCDRIFIGRH